jgi:hypothetical protein
MTRSPRSLAVEAALCRWTGMSAVDFEPWLANLNRGLDHKGISTPESLQHGRYFLSYCYDYFARNFDRFSSHECTPLCVQISLETKEPCHVKCAVTFVNAALYDVCICLGLRPDFFQTDTMMNQRPLESLNECVLRMRHSTLAVREAVLQRVAVQIPVLIQLRREFEAPISANESLSRPQCSLLLKACLQLSLDLVNGDC